MEKGDKVQGIDQMISGRIISIKNEKVLVELDEGFEIEFLKNQLVKVENFPVNINEVNQSIKEKESKKVKKNIIFNKKLGNSPLMEIDLHIEKLVKNPSIFSQKHDILLHQLDTARYWLEKNMNRGFQRMIFIHGKGDGVLKMELEYLFSRYPNITFKDAGYQKYGLGAIEIFVHQKSS